MTIETTLSLVFSLLVAACVAAITASDMKASRKEAGTYVPRPKSSVAGIVTATCLVVLTAVTLYYFALGI